MSKLSQWAGLGNNPGYDPDGPRKHRAELLRRLSFTPQCLLDNRCEMHWGIGIPKNIKRFGQDQHWIDGQQFDDDGYCIDEEWMWN